MNHTPTRRRFVGIAIVAITVASLLGAAPAHAAVGVEPGATVTIPGVTCPNPNVALVVVEPTAAGTGAVSVSGTVEFTASAAYAGTATVAVSCAGRVGPETTVVNVGEVGSAEATFTPRPAPGPCITVTLNDTGVTGIPANIRFGDVTVGQTVTSPTTVVIGSCATIDQGLTAQISDATSGSGPSQVTWEPNNGSLSPNQFSYELDIVGQTTPVPLINTPTGVATLAPVELFAATSDLTIAQGSSTGIGQQFTATLTFVAVQV